MCIRDRLSYPGKIVEGEILLEGQDLAQASEKRMREIRGNDISVIFQEPMTSLNPVLTVGKQVREAVLLHQKVSKKEARERVIEMFRQVGIPEPEERYRSYPHQLSGGLRQRVMIAMAMICNPKLLLADEPTTALDVTIEAQILHLMKQLQEKRGTAILLITHNLGCLLYTSLFPGKKGAGMAAYPGRMQAAERYPHSEQRSGNHFPCAGKRAAAHRLF